MSTPGIGTVVYRLAGLFVVVRSLPLLVDLVVRSFDQPDLLVGQFLLVALGVLLWVNASWLAERTLPKSSDWPPLNVGRTELFELGIRLIGLWLIATRGIPGALFTIVNNTAIETNFGSPNTFVTWWHLIPGVIEIAIGLWLLAAPGRIVSLVRQNQVEKPAGS